MAIRRSKKNGIFKTLGQVLFIVLAVPLLKFTGRKRINQILKYYQADLNLNDNSNLKFVDSVNDELVISLLKDNNPDLVIVNGTRIISKNVFTAINIPFINIHAGITPLYRGVHGAYWALVNNDRENVGVTIHMIDAGIDTGNIIAQTKVEINKSDNFCTYPYLQIVKSLSLLDVVITDYFQNNKIDSKSNLGKKSRLWYHPTILEYLLNLFKNKVK